MKKFLFFLIIILTAIINNTLNVYAEETKFYEGDTIAGIYFNKMPGTQRTTIYYQQARFFRDTNTNYFAYCIEPEEFFNASSTYTLTNRVPNLTEEQQKRISALAYFGYQYSNHYYIEWYPVTQYLIWKTADPQGIYYFTNGLNGPKIEPYTNQINELNSLVDNYFTKPDIKNIQHIEANKKIELHDKNKVLNNYTTSLGKIENNTLIIENLEEGEYTVNLTRKANIFKNNTKYYQAPNTQNLVMRGNLDDITNSIKLNVLKTSITIKKVNSKTKLSTRIGDASVENTTYGLYGATDELINTIKINKNGYGTIEDIPFGKYKIKEISPGEGYLLDEKEYEVNINENNSKVELQLEDDIIENMITIHKTYGESTFTDEGNVTFEIYDKDNNIIKSITTDSNGYATFNLSYGTYTLKQINSIEGYEKIEPIKIIVKDDEEQIIELKDYKIKVPNTSTHSSLLKYIFKYAYLLLC